MFLRKSFRFLLFEPNLRIKLGFGLQKSFNERELNYSNYCRYFFIWLKSIAISAEKRNGRYSLDQKDFWHWGKKFSFKKLKKKCSKVFVIKIQINRHISQVDKLFVTQNFSNITICFIILLSNQMHNNFHFHEIFSQNNFKTFIEKIRIFNFRLLKCKTYIVTFNQYIY